MGYMEFQIELILPCAMIEDEQHISVWTKFQKQNADFKKETV